MSRHDPLPLRWVVQNPDPDLPDIPDDVLEELCAASNTDRYNDAIASYLLWAMALGDRHGKRFEALGYDEIMEWVSAVVVQLHTKWLRRRGLVVIPRGGFLAQPNPCAPSYPSTPLLSGEVATSLRGSYTHPLVKWA